MKQLDFEDIRMEESRLKLNLKIKSQVTGIPGTWARSTFFLRAYLKK